MLESRPLAVDVDSVSKSFWIPDERIDTFKERVVHPLRRQHFRELTALTNVSCSIRRGEFFGIVGRNGSGKSTLLKILASIYRADHGTVRMAGRLAPFIELGVGFDPDVSARENVVLNGVMMGLTPRQAKARTDAVFEFAELEEFKELRLKNYSSGMTVRLAFSVMIEADADIMLIDEVLAVGDASFQRKCAEVFHEMRDRGKTIVLVTHDMIAVETYCDRAMLLHDGEVVEEGSPADVAREYYRLNFETVGEVDGAAISVDMHSEVLEASLLDEDGEETGSLQMGDPIRFEAVIEARTEMTRPAFVVVCINEEGRQIFGISSDVVDESGEPRDLQQHDQVRFAGKLENRLTPGKYVLTCWVRREGALGALAVQALPLADFVVYGTGYHFGAFQADGDVSLEIDSAGEGRS